MANTNDERKRWLENIRSSVAIEEAMEPYKEQKRDLVRNIATMDSLHTDEIRAAVKAYRLFKDNIKHQ